MKKVIAVIVAIMLLLPTFVFGENTDVDVKIPDYDVKVNGVKIDTEHSQYPVLVYKGVTYFPMTSDYLAGIGLDLKFSNETGIKIDVKDTVKNLDQKFLGASNVLGSTVKAKLPNFAITVNDKVIDNANEEYPVLSYKNITYFPMTWRFAVTEFGWKTSWSNEAGFGINIVKEPVAPAEPEKKALTTTEIGKLTESVVKIIVEAVDGNTYSGSGFFYNDKGGIITNVHVLVAPEKVTIIDADGKEYSKDIIVKDYSILADLIVLDTKISNESYITLSDEVVEMGNEVYAIGSPMGLDNTLSEGIVSSISEKSIQMTAAVSPGSSGGPLLNKYGECIGVVTAKVEDGENIGFAVPSRYVMSLKGRFNYSVSDYTSALKKSELYELEDGLYIGVMKKDKAEGYGEFVDLDGDIILGVSDDHILNGYVSIFYSTGNITEGTFEDDDLTYGSYRHYSEDGVSVYVGEYEDWKYNGRGEWTDADGEYYKGEFKDGTYDGYGTLELPNGDKYVGFFKAGVYDGHGRLVYSNGAIHEGGFVDGKRSGNGTYTYSNGDVKTGVWENGEMLD